MRENIYTYFARSINKFVEHKLTKVELYNIFVSCVEISTEEERNDRLEHEAELKKANSELTKLIDLPYSNWADGLQMVEK